MKFVTHHKIAVRDQHTGWGRFTWLALAAFILSIPDTDTFMAERSSAPSMFVLIGGATAEEITRLYIPLVAIGLMLALPFTNWRLKKPVSYYVVIVVLLLILGWLAAMDCFQGAGYMSIRSPSFLCIVIILLSYCCFTSLMECSNWFPPILSGIVMASLLKLVYSVYTFRNTGGVRILGGVESMQGDGGSLNLQVFVASISGLKCVEAIWKENWKKSGFFLFLNIIFVAGMAASFRRHPILQMAFICCGATLLMYWRSHLK